MINLQELHKYEFAEVIGSVVDNNDDAKQRRIKVKVPGYNDNVTVENMPWIEMTTSSINNSLDLPSIDDLVYVQSVGGELRWRHMDFIDKQVIGNFVGDDDYLKSLVLTYKNLNKVGSAGELFIGWSDAKGLQLIKDQAIVELRKDNSVLLWNGERAVHVTGDFVSIGSENISKEPAVLGDQNEIALNMINDMVKAFSQITDNMMTAIAKVAKKSPYTAHLSPVIKQYGEVAKNTIAQKHADIAAHIPKTKSEVVSVD